MTFLLSGINALEPLVLKYVVDGIGRLGGGRALVIGVALARRPPRREVSAADRGRARSDREAETRAQDLGSFDAFRRRFPRRRAQEPPRRHAADERIPLARPLARIVRDAKAPLTRPALQRRL